MRTVLEVIKLTTDFFAQRGLASPRLNAELLVGHVLGLPRMQLYLQFERVLLEPELEKLRLMVRRRGNREPVQYITGETEFFGLRLKVDRRALIPRPETEQLVEQVVQAIDAGAAKRRILDLGTGSGAIALALARRFPEAEVTAVDVSPDALALARENASATGLAEGIRFLSSDWFRAIEPAERFDVIVSNPPYLTERELAEADAEVREHEPSGALVGGGNGGIDALAAILSSAPRYLSEGGLLALETGPAQHTILSELATAAAFRTTESRRDLTGRDRFFIARM